MNTVMDRKIAEKELELLTKAMDLPLHKKTDVMFLIKNLAKRNSEHPNFMKTQELILLMKAKGWY